eukprot:3784514-Pyramimonas_sp.AAC.1
MSTTLPRGGNWNAIRPIVVPSPQSSRLKMKWPGPQILDRSKDPGAPPAVPRRFAHNLSEPRAPQNKPRGPREASDLQPRRISGMGRQ